VEWNAPDGLPARFIFLLLTPQGEDSIQLQTLSAIARAMTPENRDRLLLASERDLASLVPAMLDASCQSS